jgi:hypothetical protein
MLSLNVTKFFGFIAAEYLLLHGLRDHLPELTGISFVRYPFRHIKSTPFPGTSISYLPNKWGAVYKPRGGGFCIYGFNTTQSLSMLCPDFISAVIAVLSVLTVLLTNDFNAQTSKLSAVSDYQLLKLIFRGIAQHSILSMVPWN